MLNSSLDQEQTLQGINSTTNGAGEWDFHGTIVPETIHQGDFEADFAEILEQVDHAVDERGNLGVKAVTTDHHQITDYSYESHYSVARTSSWVRIPNIDQYPPSSYRDDVASVQSNQGSFYENPTFVDSTSTREVTFRHGSRTTAAQDTSQTTRSQSSLLNPTSEQSDSPLERWTKTYERHEATGFPKATHKSHKSKQRK